MATEYHLINADGERVFSSELREGCEVSDGYHTFGELYDHRRALTAALATVLPSWRSKAHHPDGEPMFPGYFVVGIDLPTGTVTYRYKLDYWDDFTGVEEREHAPRWDGAGPPETVDRLLEWARRARSLES